VSDTGRGEPDAGGAHNFVGSSFKIPDLGLEQVTASVNKLKGALDNLQQTMAKIQSSAAGFTNAVGSITKSLNGLAATSGGSSSTSGGGGGGSSNSGSFASTLFGQANQGLVHDMLLFPARFIQAQLANNRNVVTASGQALGMQSFATNTNMQGILSMLSKQMGGVMGGNPSDLLALMGIGGKVGAGIDWLTYSQLPGAAESTRSNQPRAAGYLESVRQGQLMNPGADVAQIAGTVGGFLANTGAQQQGAFLTGGAFSMIGAGNRAKSISEWSEGILKWFMNQRPGAKRGKPFNYGELMSQNFPGSNMDAWFTANGVPPDMRDYFWSYALGKASQTGSTGGEAILQQGAAAPQVTQQNPVYQRLAAGNVATRQSFSLGGKLSGMYGNMEQSNRWFNELLGQMIGQIMPGALSSGPLSFLQYLPDEIRDLLMSAAERTNIGAAGAGILGWGGMFADDLKKWTDKLGLDSGDVGDVGDYGSLGTSGTAGMHPDMSKRVKAMMRANPNLSITSGHRDLAKQQTLKRKGVGRVSGKPSAHTRGMAADLGPASQYGWIVKNAGKFGLKSGMGAGEPWHVGLGDPPGSSVDPADNIEGSTTFDVRASSGSGLLDMIKSLFSSFTGLGGNDPDAQMKGIAIGTSGILKALLSIFATPNANLDNLKFRDVYGTMVGATEAFFKSGETGLPTGVVTPGSGGGGGGSGSTLPGGPVSPDAVTRAAVVAKAAFNAGFRGNDLFTIVSIAGRESDWDPRAYNGNAGTRDKSYGLTQINMIDTLGPERRRWFGISANEQLFDPDTSMHATYLMTEGQRSRGRDPFYDWGPYKGMPALYSTESKQAIAREAIKQAGVGDAEFDVGYNIPSGGSRGGVTVFQNHFTVQAQQSTAGGVDVRKIADALESQMAQRMSRYN